MRVFLPSSLSIVSATCVCGRDEPDFGNPDSFLNQSASLQLAKNPRLRSLIVTLSRGSLSLLSKPQFLMRHALPEGGSQLIFLDIFEKESIFF